MPMDIYTQEQRDNSISFRNSFKLVILVFFITLSISQRMVYSILIFPYHSVSCIHQSLGFLMNYG